MDSSKKSFGPLLLSSRQAYTNCWQRLAAKIMVNKMNAFAKKLTAVREAKGITKYELAKRSGVSKQAISNLESGAREPAWETVQKLAMALAVDCTAFSDPTMTLPESMPSRPVGRPRKEPAPTARKSKARGKKKGGKA